MTPSTAPVLRVERLSKQFGPTTALAGVDLTIRPGSVHALIGMNGSGKSTLVKALSGFYVPDGGRVSVRSNGSERTDDTASALAFVHQDLGLIGEMSVLENLCLGRPVSLRRGRIDRRRERQRARRVLTPFGLERTIETEVGRLTRAEATIVAIARALDVCAEGCSVLVLDEPTSTLPASETEQLLAVMRDCAADGIGILFISHQLREVLSVSDEVTVLRNGRVSWNGPTADATVQQLVAKMTGDESVGLDSSLAYAPIRVDDADAEPSTPGRPEKRPMLVARGLSGEVVDGVDLSLGEGEIVGIAGLLGSGVEELGALLAGCARPSAGGVELDGEPLGAGGRGRIGFVPADRAERGVLRGLTVRENVSISHPGRHLRRGRLSRRRERAEVGYWFHDLMVDPPDPEADILALSGGNQQKVLVARWLAVRPRVLVAEEPTQGVDVRAKTQILDRIAAHAREGLGVVLLSGEPEEIGGLCDRMVVLRNGRLGDEFVAPFTAGQVLEAMH